MNTCRELKVKLNKTLYCKKKNKIISLNECKNCNSKSLKEIKHTNSLKKVSSSQNKQQKQRYSIIYPSLLFCAECGSKTLVEKNEVYEGAKRSVSMKNGFVVPLCKKCHDRFHNERQFALKYKKKFQAKYEETHTHQEFMNLIHQNYL